MCKKLITSGIVDETALGVLDANVVQMLAPFSRAFHGFLKKFLNKLFPNLAEISPNFLEKSCKFSACIVLSLTVIDFFLPQIEKRPT